MVLSFLITLIVLASTSYFFFESNRLKTLMDIETTTYLSASTMTIDPYNYQYTASISINNESYANITIKTNLTQSKQTTKKENKTAIKKASHLATTHSSNIQSNEIKEKLALLNEEYIEFDEPYPIDFKTIRRLEDITMVNSKPRELECVYNDIICKVHDMVHGTYKSNHQDCIVDPRICIYEKVVQRYQSNDSNINRLSAYSILPYASRFVLVPQDCKEGGIKGEICKIKGYKGPSTSPNYTELSLLTVKIDRDDYAGRYVYIHFLNIIFNYCPIMPDRICHNSKDDRWYINRESDYDYEREGMEWSIFELHTHLIWHKHDFNHICCYSLDLAECYETDGYTRICYYKRIFEIVKGYKGINSFGFRDPQLPYNKYWDKGIDVESIRSQKYSKFSAYKYVIKRDCSKYEIFRKIDSGYTYSLASVAEVCNHMKWPIRKNDSVTRAEIINDHL